MSSQDTQQNPGYDTTPPASRRMLEVALFVTFFLVILIPIFRSYFKHVMESELFGSDKIGDVGVKSRSEIVAEQRARLESAPLSVSEAAKMLSTAGRSGVPAVAPERSDDLGALEGWALSDNEAAVAAAREAVAAESAPAEEGEEQEDGEGASNEEAAQAE